MSKTYTLQDILSRIPGFPFPYDQEKLEKLTGRKTWTKDELLDIPIPHENRLWLVYLLTDEKILRELACDFAEAVLPIYEQKFPKDMRPRNAVEVARRWIEGKATDDELKTAGDAAMAAAKATGEPEGDVAWAASWAASGKTAWVAVQAAERNAADAARAMVGIDQVSLVRKKLRGEMKS